MPTPRTAAATAPVDDGRHRRRHHNREAVLDALTELFDEGLYQPTAADVAARAGVSVRSLFRYFDDVDDLTRAAIERQLARVRPHAAIDVDSTLPVADKVRAVVVDRIDRHDAAGATARAARVAAARNPLVAAQLRAIRAHQRDQLHAVFAPELQDAPDRLLAVDALCSFETYDLLRHDQRLSRARVRDVLVTALAALVAAPEGPR